MRLSPVHICIAALCAAVNVGGRAAVSADGLLARLSAAELRAAIAASQSRIHSLDVTYEMSGYSNRFPSGMFVRRRVVAKSPCSLYLDSAHGHDQLAIQEDVFRQTAYITGARSYNVFPFDRTFWTIEMEPSEPLPGTLQGELLFFATGIWPLHGRAAPLSTTEEDALPQMLIHVAQSEEYDHVRPTLELVAGRPCHVLESRGRDVLWLDAKRGCTLMARNQYVDGKLARRFELRGHRPIGYGVWFPMCLRNLQFSGHSSEEPPGSHASIDATCTILDVSLNDVIDEQFAFEPPAGALEYIHHQDGRVSAVQAKPGGIELLDELVQWMQNRSPPSTPFLEAHGGVVASLTLPLLATLCMHLKRRVGSRRRDRFVCDAG